MSLYDQFYHRMPDGTVKQINPFTKTEVWCVPERGRGTSIIETPEKGEKLTPRDPEDYCHFCESEYIFTPPEKERLYINGDGKWHKEAFMSATKINDSFAEFRRVGNLFEIVTFDYWSKNYNYFMPRSYQQWMDDYLSGEAGYEHIMNVLSLKLSRIGIDFNSLTEAERIERAAPFFGGSHELIIGRRHYFEGAVYEHDLCSSGCLSFEEHYQYMKFTIESIESIRRNNPYVHYVSIFQNWLKSAGASFDHLHRQMVGLDEWGVQAQREINDLISNPNLYNDLAANFAIYHSLTIAENDYAIAFSEIGHRFPSIAIYSKSRHIRPHEHTPEEVRGMSDLVHAIHRAITPYTSCNEEWFYAPFDCIYNLPWHILLKLRLHTPAGFEGNTKIYINPILPHKLRDEIVTILHVKRAKNEIAEGIRIGDEVSKNPNPLRYFEGTLSRS